MAPSTTTKDSSNDPTPATAKQKAAVTVPDVATGELSDPPDTPDVGSSRWFTDVGANLDWLKDAILNGGGSSGPRGEKGDRGPQGMTGPDGIPGPVGERGPQGVPGITGATGETGATGAEGPMGLDGPQGETGEPGVGGGPGTKGDPGEPGGFVVSWRDVWDADVSYAKGDIVAYTDSTSAANWIAVDTPVKGTPPADDAAWAVMLRAPAAA